MRKPLDKLQHYRTRMKERRIVFVFSLFDVVVLIAIIMGLYWLYESSPKIDANTHEKPVSPPQSLGQESGNVNALADEHPKSTRQTQRFIKLNVAGQPLADASKEWTCVLDTETKLVWEIKTHDGGWQDAEHTYTWFSRLAKEGNGPEDGGDCLYIGCDAQSYQNQLNQIALCGYANWRLPVQKEFESLDHDSNYSPDIDTRYFPNTMSSQYWTGTENPYSRSLAWSYDFSNGISYVSEKRLKYHLRMVAEAQLID